MFHESHSKSGNQSQLGGINFLPNLSSTQNFKKSITGTIFVSNLQLSLYHALKEKDQFSIFLELSSFQEKISLKFGFFFCRSFRFQIKSRIFPVASQKCVLRLADPKHLNNLLRKYLLRILLC